MIAPLRRPVLLFAALMLAGLARAEAPLPPTTAIELRVDTLRVGAGGTVILGEDQARLFVGKAALLSREITLEAGSAAGRRIVEKLAMKAEMRLVDSGTAGLTLVLKSRVKVLALSGAGPMPREEFSRDMELQIAAGASQLATVYESPFSGTKATLNIRWSVPDLTEDSQEDAAPVQVSCLLYELGETGETVLADHRLLALPGVGASATFDRVVPLPASGESKRARHEQLEIKVVPMLASGRTLSASVEVSGEVSSLLTDGTVSHPIAHQGTYLFSSGVPVLVEMEAAADNPAKEGWERVRYRLEVVTVF